MSDLPQTALCFPDYNQTCADHRRMLVLVRTMHLTGSPAKSLSPSQSTTSSAYGRVLEVLDRCHARVTVNAADDLTRKVDVGVRFIRNNYPVESNEWFEFQTHRGLLGLVSVGVYGSNQEHVELGRMHEAIKQKYARTLLCSRLIALRLESESTSKGTRLPSGLSSDLHGRQSPHVDGENEEHHNQPRLSTTNSPHDKLDYRLDGLDEKALENDFTAFLTTMFWLLEKMRVEKSAIDSSTSSSKIPLLCAPFERRDFVGLDLESRTNRRRLAGRFKKHVADLSLMCGLVREAYDLYEQACDILRSCNDWLWLANSMEGLCAIAAIVHYPDVGRAHLLQQSLKRNPSFQTLTSPQSGNHRHFSSSHSNAISTRRERIESGTTDEDFRRRVLNPKDLIDHLRDVVVHYSKYKHAGVVETEASIKAVQVLIEQGNILFGAEFLQNVVFINLQMNDDEKVHRFSALSRLYAKLGFHRKAAFFYRVAAMRCVAPQNPNTDWSHCYQLLLKTLPGYRVNFQAVPVKKNVAIRSPGWPTLQIQILQELVGTARRIGDHVTAIRHLAFIVQNFFQHLDNQARIDMCSQLSILTSKGPGTPIASTSVVLPPVNIYTVPQVTDFKPCPLVEPLVVGDGRSSGADATDSPFIFTPIVQLDSTRKQVITWVQDEVANVDIAVINPLNSELRISNMTLLHEGAEFDAFPASFILNGDESSKKVILKLSGIPRKPGLLHLLGYSCVVFGVRSNCRLKSLGFEEDRILIEVCPSIPRLEMTIVDEGKHLRPDSSLEMDLFHGETKCLTFSLLNASSLSVEQLSVKRTVRSLKFEKYVQIDNVERKLVPGSSVDFTVRLTSPPTRCQYHEPEDPSEDEDFSLSTADSFCEQFVVTLSVEYSSQVSETGYGRKLIQKVIVKLRPSLLVSWWDILPGDDDDQCYVVVDVRNLTEFEAELRYSTNKLIIVDQRSTCRVPVVVKKVAQCEQQSEEIQRQRFLASYLDQEIGLEWLFPAVEKRSGRISLADISLWPEMISRLESSSVSWTLDLNGCRWLGASLNFPAGEPIRIDMSLCNDYKIPIEGKFTCNCHYAIEGGKSTEMSASSTSHEIPVSGSQSIEHCEPGQCVSYSALVIPCQPGKISLTLVCEVFKDTCLEKVDHIVIPNVTIHLS